MTPLWLIAAYIAPMPLAALLGKFAALEYRQRGKTSPNVMDAMTLFSAAWPILTLFIVGVYVEKFGRKAWRFAHPKQTKK